MLSLKTKTGNIPAYCLEVIAISNFLYFAHRSSHVLGQGYIWFSHFIQNQFSKIINEYHSDTGIEHQSTGRLISSYIVLRHKKEDSSDLFWNHNNMWVGIFIAILCLV